MNSFAVLTPVRTSKTSKPVKQLHNTPVSTPIKSLKGLDMTPLESKKVKRVEITPSLSPLKQLKEEKFTTRKIIRTRQCMFGVSCRFRNVAKTNGFPCDFAHTTEELNTVAREVKTIVQNLEKTKPCWSGLHCATKGCTFAHTPDELNVRTCYLGGNCTNVDCAYAHPGVVIDKVLLYTMMRKSQEKEKMIEMGPAPVLETTEEQVLDQMRELEKESEKFEVMVESDDEEDDEVQTLTEQFTSLTMNEIKKYDEDLEKCACSETQTCLFHSDEKEKKESSRLYHNEALKNVLQTCLFEPSPPPSVITQTSSEVWNTLSRNPTLEMISVIEKKPEKKSWSDITDEEDMEREQEMLKEKTPKKWSTLVNMSENSDVKTTVVTFKPSPQKQTQNKQKTPLKTQKQTRTQFPLYYRTNMCRNGLKCKRGERCDFAHTKQELRPVCCQTENCENDSCKFYHEGDTLPSSDELYQDWQERTQ